MPNYKRQRKPKAKEAVPDSSLEKFYDRDTSLTQFENEKNLIKFSQN